MVVEHEEDDCPCVRFDRLAEAFRRDTGMMAPGKDCPAAMGGMDDDEGRMRAWAEWLKTNGDKR